MFTAFLASIIPTFGIIFIGWLTRKVGVWKKSAISVLNGYAFYIALPALIFHTLIISPIREIWGRETVLLISGTVVAHIIVVLILFPFLKNRKISKSICASLPMLTTLGSTAYLGIPYATFTFGAMGTVYASLLSVALVVSMLCIGIFSLNQFASATIKKDVLITMIELPFLWAVLLGILWPLFELPTIPLFLDRLLSILSESAGPTALLGLGAFLFDIKPQSIFSFPVIMISLIKVVLPTTITVTLLTMLNIHGIPLFVAASMGATSTAVTTFVLADHYNIARKLTAEVILLSTFFSLITLSIISAMWFRLL